jgi:UDP-glucose 4-epimerase
VIGRAVVTGGAGFIGSHLVDRIVDEGGEVLVIDDLSTGKLERLGPALRSSRVKIHQMDIRAPELQQAATQFKPEVVFHLAAQADVRRSVEDPVHDASVNVLGTVSVLEAARASGAARIVFTSSGGAIYGDAKKLPVTERTPKRPESPYGVSKKIVEDYFRYYAEAYDLDFVMIAPANVYGPRQDPHGEAGVVAIFTQAMLERRRPVVFGDGTQTRDFVYVEDVVDGFVRAAYKGEGRLINLGSGRETSVLELYEAIAGELEFRRKPEMAPAKPGDVQRSVVDAALAKRLLDWEAWTPLGIGIRRTVAWYRGLG